MSYQDTLPYRLHGIPCQIGVKHVKRVEGTFSRNADSDMDYYGWAECDWDVLDRRGKPAPWLARKLTLADCDDIENRIFEALT